jgi:hypothetical protein
MSFSHGRKTYISLNGVDLSAYVTTSALEKTVDKSDVTTYGNDNHVYATGLKDGTCTMSGIFDNTAGGPRATIQTIIAAGATVTLIRRPDGTGTGKAQDSVSVVVEKYNETSPVADYVTWSCDMQMSGAVTTTPQP